MNRELVVYTRSTPCADVDRTRRDLDLWGHKYREVDIDSDPAAARRLREWTGFESVPTVLVAEGGSAAPMHPPAGLVPGQTPRNVDRGSMITEPSSENLQVFLEHNGFLKPDLFRMGSFLKG